MTYEELRNTTITRYDTDVEAPAHAEARFGMPWKFLKQSVAVSAKFAQKYENIRGIEFDDLFAAGMLGAAQSYDRFDYDNEATWITYCYLRIRGAIINHVRNVTGRRDTSAKRDMWKDKKYLYDKEGSGTDDARMVIDKVACDTFKLPDIEYEELEEKRNLEWLLENTEVKDSYKEAVLAWTENGAMTKLAAREGVTIAGISYRAKVTRRKMKENAIKFKLMR